MTLTELGVVHSWPIYWLNCCYILLAHWTLAQKELAAEPECWVVLAVAGDPLATLELMAPDEMGCSEDQIGLEIHCILLQSPVARWVVETWVRKHYKQPDPHALDDLAPSVPGLAFFVFRHPSFGDAHHPYVTVGRVQSYCKSSRKLVKKHPILKIHKCFVSELEAVVGVQWSFLIQSNLAVYFELQLEELA